MITLLRCKVINQKILASSFNASKNLFSTSTFLKQNGEESSKKNEYYDIVVCGGGMVGAAMTLALGQDNLFKNLKIAMIDTAPEKKDYKGPELHNFRVCALSKSTIELLKSNAT